MGARASVYSRCRDLDPHEAGPRGAGALARELPHDRPRHRVRQPLPPQGQGVPGPDRHRPGRSLPRRQPGRGPAHRSAPRLADERLVKVLHGADYDVTTLKRDFGFRFASLFDTMIAARLLGRSELGLVAVARDELGVTLTKTNQKDDWSRRPLTPQQEAYALADVVHLVALRERLAERLAAVVAPRVAARGVRRGRRARAARRDGATPTSTSRSRAPGASRRARSRRCASSTPGASGARRRPTRRPSASSATRAC